MFSLWQLLRLLKSKNVKRFLISILAIGIFTPTWQSGEESFIAPAILVGAFDFLDGLDRGLAAGLNEALKSLLPMALLIFISTGIFIGLKIIQTQKEKSDQPKSE